MGIVESAIISKLRNTMLDMTVPELFINEKDFLRSCCRTRPCSCNTTRRYESFEA